MYKQTPDKPTIGNVGLRSLFASDAQQRKNIATWWALIGFVLGAQLVLLWMWLRRKPEEYGYRSPVAEPTHWHPGPVELKPEAATSVTQEEAPPIQETGPAAPTETRAEAVEMKAAAPATEDKKADDLRKIEGIGPKVSTLLKDSGVKTYDQLAEASVDRLREILDEAGLRMMNPATWPEQAKLAAQEKWEELSKLKDQLRAGRRGG